MYGVSIYAAQISILGDEKLVSTEPTKMGHHTLYIMSHAETLLHLNYWLSFICAVLIEMAEV